jgi:hypothetical protein
LTKSSTIDIFAVKGGKTMARTGKTSAAVPSKYQQVKLSALKKGRRGKHHDLVEGILDELQRVPAGSALQVPLDGVVIGLPNVRSAVHRGASAKGLEIETLADEKHFYVFKKAEG